MTPVKGETEHVQLTDLLVGALDQIRARPLRRVLARPGREDLRPSHLRVASAVPPEGIGITDLAARLGMTKQGCGQMVAALTASGYARVDPDPDDRRRRAVSLTPAGGELVVDADHELAAFERALTERVGPDRVAALRAVLGEVSRLDG